MKHYKKKDIDREKEKQGLKSEPFDKHMACFSESSTVYTVCSVHLVSTLFRITRTCPQTSVKAATEEICFDLEWHETAC